MSKHYEFPCGCKLPVMGEEDGRPRIQFDPQIEKIPLDCDRTWDLISSGNTKGVFQLESRLGQMMAKRLKPRNIEHLSALVAIMRPGCLEAMRDGKSVTQHYIDRKNGNEDVDLFHPALKGALGPTYGEMIYQEQAMRVAQDVAGFDLQQADILRKAIGKKKPEIMAQCKEAFMKGAAEEKIITKEQAEQIFGWIEKSQRYSFNKSHSVSYAINSYLSAYAKAHFPRVFFTSYLYYSNQKQRPHEEINELANNAKLMDIEVYPPDLRHMNTHFKLIDGNIYFGMSDVKGIGDAVIRRLATHITTCEKEIAKPRDEWGWIEFLVFLSPNVNSTAVKALISSGALAYMKVQRTKMLFDYEVYSKLSTREQAWVKQLSLTTVPNSLEEMLLVMTKCKPGRKGACATKKRLGKVQGFYGAVVTPPYEMKDTPEWLASVEESLLGIPITCTVVDACDTDAANCTCRDFLNREGGRQGVILLACQLNTVNEIVTKKGKNPGQKMAFLTVSDNSGLLDSVVAFPSTWKEYKSLLTTGNTIMLCGERGKEKDSLIVKKVWQI